MPHQVDSSILIESALRMEIMGRKGVWYQGRIHTSKELRKLNEPIFPLPPFSAREYYLTKNGSSSSDSN